MTSADDVKLGIYRHWKGPLYQVLGLAHDANAEDLIDNERFHAGPMGERVVVVYIGLELNGAHLGPRLCVRTLEDFLARVHTEDGSTCAGEQCFRYVGDKYADRFTYLGPVLTEEMLQR